MDSEETPVAEQEKRGLPEGVRKVGSGFATEDGRMTPAARAATEAAAKSAAALRRERLAREDVTKLTLYEREGETWFIATWGRNDRAEWRTVRERAQDGKLAPTESGEPLAAGLAITLTSLYCGVRTQDGEKFFTIEDVLEYSKGDDEGGNDEDAALIVDLTQQVALANPLMFPGYGVDDVEELSDLEKKIDSENSATEKS